jgi:hypothetical protein
MQYNEDNHHNISCDVASCHRNRHWDDGETVWIGARGGRRPYFVNGIALEDDKEREDCSI